MRRNWALAAVVIGTLLSGPLLRADDETQPKKASKSAAAKQVEEEKPAEDRYTLPEDADVETLMKFVKEIQEFRPKTVAEAREHQQKGRIAIADAARAILDIEKDTKSEAYLFAKTTELGSEVRGLIAASPDERQAYLDQVSELLKNPHAGQQQLSLAMTVARMLEQVDEKASIAAYKSFGAALSKSPDKAIAERARMLTGAARRMELPGNTLELQGDKVDGKKFDLAELKGKVVLIDFWATWCGPCIAEIPNMKKLYKEYHDQGFEIVGLSLDQDRGDLETFLEEKELPWIILHDKENEGQHPAAKDLGIFGIPTMILVGKDGKVLDIHARGEKLAELLEEQFAKGEAAVEEAAVEEDK